MAEIKEKKVGKEEAGQRIRIKIRSFDHKIIDQSTKTIVDTVSRTGAKQFKFASWCGRGN